MATSTWPSWISTVATSRESPRLIFDAGQIANALGGPASLLQVDDDLCGHRQRVVLRIVIEAGLMAAGHGNSLTPS